MQKEFAQFVFYSKNGDELFSFSSAIVDMKLPDTIRIDHKADSVCLLSSDLESLVTLYENFKGEEQFTLEPVVYVAPTQRMAHGGLSVEVGETPTGFDLWLEVSPSDVFENEIEHSYPANYDTQLIEQQIRKLFTSTLRIDEPVCRTKVKVLSFKQDGEPSRASLTDALRGAFEGALLKADPTELEAVMSVSLSVVERQFDSAKALLDTLGGVVVSTDTSGKLKKVVGEIPVAAVLENYTRLVNITKDGDLGIELKEFVAVSR